MSGLRAAKAIVDSQKGDLGMKLLELSLELDTTLCVVAYSMPHRAFVLPEIDGVDGSDPNFAVL